MTMKKILFPAIIFATLHGFPSNATAFFSSEKSAETLLSEIASLDPAKSSKKLAALYADLGRVYYRQDQMQSAADAYENAIKHNPTRALKKHIYLYMGKSYEGFQLEKSRQAHERAVLYDRKNWRRHQDLALILERLGKFDQAAESYRRAIKYNPKSGSVYIHLGRTHRKLGLLKLAQLELEKAQDYGANSAQLNRELSLVLEGRGQFSAAALQEKNGLTPQSSVGEWGRLVYLAALAGDKKLANEGLIQIRSKETPADTLSFYEELADCLGRKSASLSPTSLNDATLRRLVENAIVAPEQP
jgi:tetratricopeptide (TPR) repeat protein